MKRQHISTQNPYSWSKMADVFLNPFMKTKARDAALSNLFFFKIFVVIPTMLKSQNQPK